MIQLQLQPGASIPYPNGFISDGDTAIRAAKKLVWPDTLHLLCIWHIIAKNAPDNLIKVVGKDNCKFQSFDFPSNAITLPNK